MKHDKQNVEALIFIFLSENNQVLGFTSMVASVFFLLI